MDCETVRGRLDEYLDGALSPAESVEVESHLPACPVCPASLLARLKMKAAVRDAARAMSPDPELRARLARSLRSRRGLPRLAVPLAAAAALLLVTAGALLPFRGAPRAEKALSELTDLHLANLAAATRVEVASSDRHTVKPWFQGRIPFTFPLPDLTAPFTLAGGRVTSLGQTPAAHLLFTVREHQISAFIVPESSDAMRCLVAPAGARRFRTFAFETFLRDGLIFAVAGDAAPEDVHALAEILRKAPF